jgi:hypothetical protein
MNPTLWAATTIGSACVGTIPGYLFAVFLDTGEPLALVFALFCLASLVVGSVAGALVCARSHQRQDTNRHHHKERPLTEAELDSSTSSD